MRANVRDTAQRIAASSLTDSALRAFLDLSDSFALATGDDRVAPSADEPQPTGSAPWDAALAALVDFWLGESGLPKPDWVESPSRFLTEPATPHLGQYDLSPDRADVPPEFFRRNILIERRTLRSV